MRWSMATVCYFDSMLVFTDGPDARGVYDEAEIDNVVRRFSEFARIEAVLSLRFYDIVPAGQMLFVQMNGQNHVCGPGTIVEAYLINIGRLLKFNRYRYTRLAYPFVPEGKVVVVKTDGGMEILTAGTRMTVDEVLQGIELKAPFRQGEKSL